MDKRKERMNNLKGGKKRTVGASTSLLNAKLWSSTITNHLFPLFRAAAKLYYCTSSILRCLIGLERFSLLSQVTCHSVLSRFDENDMTKSKIYFCQPQFNWLQYCSCQFIIQYSIFMRKSHKAFTDVVSECYIQIIKSADRL